MSFSQFLRRLYVLTVIAVVSIPALLVFALLVFAIITLSGCASIERVHASQWPQPRIDYFHAANPEQRDAYLRTALAQRPGWIWMKGTGVSMQPHLANRPGDRLLYEPVAPGRRWTRADIGLVVCFARQPVHFFARDRWDSAPRMETVFDPQGQRVTHMIVDVSADGRALFLDGTNTPRPDGWQRDPVVQGILRIVVTVPPGAR